MRIFITEEKKALKVIRILEIKQKAPICSFKTKNNHSTLPKSNLMNYGVKL